MTWCNDSDDQDRGIQLITSTFIRRIVSNETDLVTHDTKLPTQIRTLTCPSCGHNIQFQDQVF